jgi:hypothetical protein
VELPLGNWWCPTTRVTTPPKMDTNCITPSLIPTVDGSSVRSFYCARTTVRSPRKLNHGLALTTSN